MLISILRQPKTWGKMFHQLSAILALFDLVYAGPTLVNKANQSIAICSFQEYLLQCGMLGKASVTVAICYISMRTIRDLESQSTKFVFSFLGTVLLVAAGCLGLSVYFNTASVWCADHEWETLSSLSQDEAEVAYIMTVTTPVLICVMVNTYCFVSIMSRLKSQQRSNTNSVNSGQSTMSNETKLFRVVQHIIFYPIVLVISFIPEIGALSYSLITGKFNRVLYSIATVFMGLNGAAMAINFFRQQKLHPNLQKITFGLRNHPVFRLGRNWPSMMSIFSNESSTATDSSFPSTRNPVLQGSDNTGGGESGITLTDSSYMTTASSATTTTGMRYSTQFESDTDTDRNRNSEDFGGNKERRYPVF
jgi:hypothetical protein